MSFNCMKDATHSSFWKGKNGPEYLQNVLNVRYVQRNINTINAFCSNKDRQIKQPETEAHIHHGSDINTDADNIEGLFRYKATHDRESEGYYSRINLN